MSAFTCPQHVPPWSSPTACHMTSALRPKSVLLHLYGIILGAGGQVSFLFADTGEIERLSGSDHQEQTRQVKERLQRCPAADRFIKTAQTDRTERSQEVGEGKPRSREFGGDERRCRTYAEGQHAQAEHRTADDSENGD